MSRLFNLTFIFLATINILLFLQNFGNQIFKLENLIFSLLSLFLLVYFNDKKREEETIFNSIKRKWFIKRIPQKSVD